MSKPYHKSLFTSMLFQTLWLVSCDAADRAVSVSCAADGEDLAAQFETPFSKHLRIGYANPNNYSPGSILQLPDHIMSGTSRTRLVYVLKTHDRDFSRSKPETWLAPILDTTFQIKAERDVEEAARAAHINLRQEISAHSVLYFSGGAWRKELVDAIALINADPAAVAAIKKSRDAGRFVVITAASYGRSAELFYVGEGLSQIRHFSLQVSFGCPAVERITTLADHSLRQVTMIVFYTPIKYNERNNRVEVNLQMLLSNGTLRVDE